VRWREDFIKTLKGSAQSRGETYRLNIISKGAGEGESPGGGGANRKKLNRNYVSKGQGAGCVASYKCELSLLVSSTRRIFHVLEGGGGVGGGGSCWGGGLFRS